MQRGHGAGGAGDGAAQAQGGRGQIAAHMNNSAAGYQVWILGYFRGCEVNALSYLFQPEEVQMQNLSLYGGGGNNAQQQAMYASHHGNHLVRFKMFFVQFGGAIYCSPQNRNIHCVSNLIHHLKKRSDRLTRVHFSTVVYR